MSCCLDGSAVVTPDGVLVIVVFMGCVALLSSTILVDVHTFDEVAFGYHCFAEDESSFVLIVMDLTVAIASYVGVDISLSCPRSTDDFHSHIAEVESPANGEKIDV